MKRLFEFNLIILWYEYYDMNIIFNNIIINNLIYNYIILYLFNTIILLIIFNQLFKNNDWIKLSKKI